MSDARRPQPDEAAEAGSGAGRTVRIDYRRLPDRVRVFRQRVVLERPMRIHGRVAMQNDSLALWFTFPGQWHDIGRFHLADGTFTGIYANILTPPRIRGDAWDTTDLFLDVWLAPDAGARILDEDELEEALAGGTIEPALAASAREEAARLLRLAEEGAWPPPVVHEWTLERALAALGGEGAEGERA